MDTVDDVTGRDEATAVDLGSLLQHDLRPVDVVRLHESFEADTSLLGGDLMDEVRVDFGVGDVGVEVVASSTNAGILEMMVHPTEQNLLWRESQEVLDAFAVLQQSRQAWTILEGDLIKETYTDDLPEQPEHQMRRAFGQVVSVDVDDVAADRLRGGESQRQVLVHPVEGQVLFVDRALVDRVWTRVVDDFTVENQKRKYIGYIMKNDSFKICYRQQSFI